MKRNEELERLILEAPEDVGRYAVYGDWLTERADPRGELVAVQVALADPARSIDRALHWQEQYLLREHREHLLGALAGCDRWIEVEHTRGFLGTIKLGTALVLEEDGSVGHDVLGRVVDALGAPEGRFVHSIFFDLAPGSADFGPVLRRLEKHGPYPAVRALTLHVVGGTGGDLGALWALFPRLRSLTIRQPDASLRLGTPIAPELEEVVLERAGYLSLRAYDTLFAVELPRLRSVVIDAPRAYVVDSLGDLLAARITPHLRKLSILCHRTDAGMLAHRLSRSQLLDQLRVLDLSSGDLGDGEAVVLARSGRLLGLARLVVSDNELTHEGLAALRAACPNVVSDMQRNDDDDDDDPF